MSRPKLPRLGLCMALAGAPLFFPLYAQTTAQHYSIPAGSLDSALLATSRQSGQLIVFEPSAVIRHSTNGVEGDFTLDELLTRLLDGQGLEYSRDNRGAILVRASSASSLNLPSTEIHGEYSSSALASQSTPTTRTGTPLHLTPQSINVINSEIMEAQGARTVSDALRNVSGVTVIPSSLGSASLNIRGYQANVLSQGVNTSSLSTPLAIPAIALEAVEVIKGPSAILVGSGSPGGTVNLVHKVPQPVASHEISLGYGSHDERRLSADSTGLLGTDGRLSYRVILDGRQSSGNAGDYDGHKEFYFSPSLRWLDDSTDFTLRYSRTVRTTPFLPYTVMYRGEPYGGDLPEPLGNREDSLRLQQNEFHYSLEQALGEHWTFVSKGTYTDVKEEQFGWYTGSELLQNGSVWLTSFAQGGESHQHNLDNYLRGIYQWGELQSTSVFGVSASRTRSHNDRLATFSPWHVVSIHDPLPALPSARSGYVTSFTESKPVGAYWQQQLDYGAWHLTGGLRFSSSWNGVFRRDEASESQKRQVWSPSIGLLYEATPWLSVYASHLRGYQPPSYVDRDGDLLPEQTSKQNEAGLKFSLLDQRLNLTTSVYRIEFDNYAFYDARERGYVSVPGYLSRGFEIDVQGSLTDNLDLVGHYNNNRAEFAQNRNYQAALPRHRASLWSRYRFQNPALKGFSASVGLTYTGTAYLDRDENYRIPEQLQTDLGVEYSHGNYSLELIARNLFDEDLYSTSMNGDPYFIPLQQPREFQLTASYRF
ncbi:iron complex outermembrane recepter protein [Pseudomonas flavescens]|uniref:Iron complex outermembrane recepter protein n=1 Tax=Phytopseudomonas flavescens TaxID=29435 RepID=A0A1G8KUE8_9GAMM|nr:TonB-dependent receptor [Pseudomonas flavescens]SDI46957.1 iron complex outermembrane recepter protein [Pseudomonas flavescens]